MGVGLAIPVDSVPAYAGLRRLADSASLNFSEPPFMRCAHQYGVSYEIGLVGAKLQNATFSMIGIV